MLVPLCQSNGLVLPGISPGDAVAWEPLCFCSVVTSRAPVSCTRKTPFRTIACICESCLYRVPRIGCQIQWNSSERRVHTSGHLRERAERNSAIRIRLQIRSQIPIADPRSSIGLPAKTPAAPAPSRSPSRTRGSGRLGRADLVPASRRHTRSPRGPSPSLLQPAAVALEQLSQLGVTRPDVLS